MIKQIKILVFIVALHNNFICSTNVKNPPIREKTTKDQDDIITVAIIFLFCNSMIYDI